MAHDYPDDGHIFVCVRVRDIVTVPGMSVNDNSATPRPARDLVRDAQRICVSTLENIVVLHDPKSIDNVSSVARDADGVVRLLTSRSSGDKDEHHFTRRFLTSTATASYFEYDKCINSMDADSMLQMPLIRDSDFIRPPECGTQEDVYLSTAVHAVTAAVEGINSCVFAYGQTGSGKTFTLFGDTACISRDPGVVPRTIDDLFKRLENIRREYQSNSETEYSYRVQVSFFEIYQNEVYCLFSRKGPLRVNFIRDAIRKEEMMTIHDLRQQVVTSAESVYPLMEMGLRRRQTGETGMNARSSRSHAIFQVCVTQWRTNRITKESVELNATMNLVDLAGSERQTTAKTDGKSCDEGIQINQSLATMARVINEISHGAKSVSYKDSLLTMVLKDNLGGNSKTFMIATISPAAFCHQESCATLQCAKDVRKIRNRPTVNRTFQTRSNLLDLNARLKEENEQLKQRVGFLMKQCNEDVNDDDNNNNNDMAGQERTADGNGCAAPLLFEKATGIAKGCGGAIKGGMNSGNVATEAMIAVQSVGAAPLVVTAYRKYASLAGIGGSCVEGGSIGVTSLAKEIVQFNLADMLPSNERKSALREKEEDYGIIEFERVSQSSCEQRYWLRYIPAETANNNGSALQCQVNGSSLKKEDCRQLMHGDVVTVFIDATDNNDSEQKLLSFHYVDINCLSRRGNADTGITTGDLMVSYPLCDTHQNNDNNVDVEQLLREKAKLLEMVREQARTIKYQCQRDAESRSRMGSMANAHIREGDDSLSPAPMIPLESINMGILAATPQQAGEAARMFHRTSLLPSDLYDHRVSSLRFEDSVQENQLPYKGVMERNATLEELARRLAELEKSPSPPHNPPLLSTLTAGGAARLIAPPSMEKISVSNKISESCSVDEVSPSESPLPMADDEDIIRTEQGVTEGGEGVEAAAVKESDAGAGVATADEILRNHRNVSELEELGRMHVHLSTSDGVRERYYAAKRERVLCERIWSLEQLLEDLRGELNLLESKLRIAQDTNTESELQQAQMEDEMAEVSKALLDATEENANLVRDISSLEAFLNQTEEALAEASAVNEAELEKRLANMAEEIRALKVLARMWKRRAMQNIALEFGDGKNIIGGTGEGVVVNVSGRVPWDDLRMESNAARAKKLLGEYGCTIPTASGNVAADTIDRFEKDTSFETVVALETVLAGLEKENLHLIDEIKDYEKQLQEYETLVDRLRREKEEFEKKEKMNLSMPEEELQRFKRQYANKCEELELAEKQYADAATKLEAVVQKNKVVKKKSVKSNDLLLEEQRRVIEEQKIEFDKLKEALAWKDEELQSLLQFVRNRGDEINGFKDDGELRDRIEDLLADAIGDCTGGSVYSAFPPDFQFSHEVVALIRICLRVMMDRLKIELYVLNRQSLHKFGLLVPAVQLRPETQFHSFMHELRGVVAEIAGKTQQIGGKWSVEESDILSRLVDHRRRRAGNALNGLLIWYDHWDLSPKSEHVCYMELIRNMERIMQVARMVREESLVNTNATSTLRLILPGKNGAPDIAYVPSSGKDTSITESCRILEKLSAGVKSGNLARAVEKSKLAAKAASGFQRSQTTFTSDRSPRKSELGSSQILCRTATSITALNPTYGMKNDRQAQQGLYSDKNSSNAEGNFGRRGTALVLPASENDVEFVASSTFGRQNPTFNFERNKSTLNFPDAGFAKPASKLTRFARAKTDVPSFSAFSELYSGKLSGSQTLAQTMHTENSPMPSQRTKTATAGTAAKPTTKTGPAANSFRRTRTAQFARTVTTGAPLLSSRISGRRIMTGQASHASRLDSPRPSIPSTVTPKSFYDPNVLNHLKQRTASESNEVSQRTPKRNATGKVNSVLSIPPRSPPAALSRTPSGLNTPSLSMLSAKETHPMSAGPAVSPTGSSLHSSAHPSMRQEEKNQAKTAVPPLYLDRISK